MSPRPPAILFTAFEPSGDALAAPVIRELRSRRPDWQVWAMGGPLMAAAGAELIQITTEHAAMGAAAAGHVMEHYRRLAMLRTWISEYQPIAHVPVDSPAANWSICKLIRRRARATPTGRPARIVHLAAPQLWAWASWRIARMRRLSDHVLCLLPFEPDWFMQRRMPATFVGHPLFDTATTGEAVQATTDDALPTRSPRIALLPGSRRAEVVANLPTMLEAAQRVCMKHDGASAVVAAANESIATLLRTSLDAGRGDIARRIAIVTGRTPQVLQWCDAAVVVSGTATLLTARHAKPMVALYNVNRWTWALLGRWLVRTRTFTLPNLIAEHAGKPRIAPEFVPHFGDAAPIADALDAILTDAGERQRQTDAMHWLASLYEGRHFASDSAGKLIELIGT